MTWMRNLNWVWYWNIERKREKAVMWIVWHLPRWLIYWAVIRCWANGTMIPYGDTHPDELGWSEALKRWQHTPAAEVSTPP